MMTEDVSGQRLWKVAPAKNVVGFIGGKGVLAAGADHGNLFVADQIRFGQRVPPITLAYLMLQPDRLCGCVKIS